MFKRIVIIAVVLIAAVLAYAATRPDQFSVERSIVIDAPPERAFVLVNDFHAWQGWSPWEGLDPALQRQYSGPDRGVGAVYAWQGNGKVGKGRMEIVEATPSSAIGIQLDFIEPFAAHNRADFTFAEQGGKTTVRWVMTGHNPYIAKLMQLFFSMDRMVGGQFEQGLTALKRLAETPPAA